MDAKLSPPSPSVLVRALKPGDVEPLVALVKETGVFQAGEVEVARELLEAGVAKGEFSGYLFFVAHALPEDVLAGYACYGETPCTEGTFDLYWIATASGLRGRQVASHLLRDVVSDVTRRGGRLLVAETEDSTAYAAARGFYETRGFRRAAEISDFYRPGVAKVIYAKAVSLEGGA